MTKKTHEMQAERKENKWATSSVSPGFGFIVLSSVFGFCFFPSSRVKYHHQIGGILFFNSTIGFDSVNFDGFCPSVASPWFPADWHRFTPPPPSAIFFLFFLAVSVSVCRWFIAGWWYWNSTRVLAPRWPPIEIGFQLSFIYVTFVSNFRIGFQWKHGGFMADGFPFLYWPPTFWIAANNKPPYFFLVFGSVYSEFDYFHKNFKKIKINRWKKFQKKKKNGNIPQL